MAKKYLIIAGLILVSLVAVSTKAALSEEDIFPKSIKGLPLYAVEKIEPDEQVAEGFLAGYGTDDSTVEITLLFCRGVNEEVMETAIEDFLSGFEAEAQINFFYIEKQGPKEVEIKGKKAQLFNYKLYLYEDYFIEIGLGFVIYKDYFIAVQIANYEGKRPSDSDLKEVVGIFVDKIPDQGAICGNTYCEQGEDCSNCPQDCGACHEPLPDIDVFLAEKNINLELGGSKILKMELKNNGQGKAKGVNFEIYVDRPEVVRVYPEKRTVGNIGPGEQRTEQIEIAVKDSGKAYLAIHIRGDNVPSIMKFVQVKVPEALSLSVPESIFLSPDETQEISVFITNAGDRPIYVHKILLQSKDSSVVYVEQGAEMDVTGQGEGVCCGRVISTENDDITNAIYPKPKIKAKSVGGTELVFKVLYEGKTLEKKVRVGVGESIGGKRPELELGLKPAGLLLELDEAREVEIILKNTGSEIIKEGKIYISPSREAPFEATRQITFGFIRPGKEAKAEIEIIGHPQFPHDLSGGDLSVTGTLTFDGQFITLDGRTFDFEKEMRVSLVEEREKCSAQDKECRETVGCLVDLSNEMGCVLEFADVIPYFDKPVAVVLATSDVCELKGRVESGDAIGAAISSLLMTVDLGDNALDAVPGAGNILSAFSDLVEGSVDCVEGFIYDAVNDYCAGGKGGYTGCAKNLFDLIAAESGRWKEPKAAKNSVVAIGGSPITLAVLDDSGKELTLKDGVLVIEEEDLKLVFIKNPDDLENGYNFQVQGISQGEYDLDIGLISEGEVLERVELRDQPVALDETIEVSSEELFPGREAEKRQKLILYLIIWLAAGAVLVSGVVVLVIVLIKKKKKKGRKGKK